MGISNVEFAAKARVDRGTLGRALKDDERVGAKTWSRIEQTATKLERELGMDEPAQVQPIGDPAEDLVTFEVQGNFGVRAVVKGPVRDLAALQDAVSKIIADMQSGEIRQAD